MPLTQRPMSARPLRIVALGATAIVIAGSGMGPALAAYGPPPPPPPVPGGYFRVVTSQTIGPKGALIGPLKLGRLLAALQVPKSAFPGPLQITITKPDTGGIGNAGFPRYRAVGGVGIQVQLNGSRYRKAFHPPLILQITSRLFASGDLLVVWNGKRFMVAQHDTSRTGTVTIPIYNEHVQDFAILGLAGSGSAHTGAKAVKGKLASATFRPITVEAVIGALLGMPGRSLLPGVGVLTR